jgi:ferritin
VPAPKGDFTSPLDAANAVRDQERATTEMIHRLYELARKEGDYALEVLLHWYITEQVEEEKWSGELAALMEQFQERPGEVFMRLITGGPSASKDSSRAAEPAPLKLKN